MPYRQGDSDRPPGIARRRLNPDVFKRAFAQNPSVADAVERDSACQTQAFHAGFFVGIARHVQHHFFGDDLYAAGKVHVLLRQFGFRLARRLAEQFCKRAVGHPQAVSVAEVFMVHSQAAVVAHLYEFLFNQRDIFWLAVWRESHHFVLAAVDLESCVVGECAVEKAEAVREAKLFEHGDFVAPAYANRACRPLANAVHRQDSRFGKRRWVERARGVALVMIPEKNLPRKFLRALFRRFVIFNPARLCHLDADHVRHPEFFFHPERHRFEERWEARGRVIEIGFKQALEFEKRLVVKADVIELVNRQPRLFQTVPRGICGEAVIVFDAGKAFFLSSRDYFTVCNQARRRVVIECRYA